VREGTFEFAVEHFPWARTTISSGYYIPPDGLGRLNTFDAIYFGAVGSAGA
jgi:tartrate dehydrogenase/decarboxylase/D-malate dehydrogenase